MWDFRGMLLFATCTVATALLQQQPRRAQALKFTSFHEADSATTLVVDCTHPTCRQLTHHLKVKGQRELHLGLSSLRADSTTEQVLLAVNSPSLPLAPFRHVSTNHFDVDSFLSVWTACNPQVALSHYNVLKVAAMIGDFRELSLSSEDGDETAFKALALVCWLNSEEKRLFYKPFEGSISRAMGEGEEGDEKFNYFLPKFQEVLEDPMKFADEWEEEYQRVVQEYSMLHFSGIGGGSPSSSSSSSFEHFRDISLVVVRSPSPCHYYALFSASIGADVVLSIYSGNRYELEIKYTTYIDLHSRPCLPRVELEPLVKRLNELELELKLKLQLELGTETETKTKTKPKTDVKADQAVEWFANRINDSGPLCRLEAKAAKHLTKAERYGHPFERPIYSSSIPPAVFEATVRSFFAHAYASSSSSSSSSSSPQRCRKDWTWADYTAFNRNIDWSKTW